MLRLSNDVKISVYDSPVNLKERERQPTDRSSILRILSDHQKPSADAVILKGVKRVEDLL